ERRPEYDPPGLTRRAVEFPGDIPAAPRVLKKRSESARLSRGQQLNWSPSKHPSWLTDELYLASIQPLLKTLPRKATASALGVTQPTSEQSSLVNISLISGIGRSWWGCRLIIEGATTLLLTYPDSNGGGLSGS